MTEDISTQFKVEGQPAFPIENKENDNSADSSSGEKTNIDQTQSQEGEQNSGVKKDDDAEGMGLADHPRWKEREDDWTKRFNDQETRHVDEIAKLRKEVEDRFTTSPKKEASDQNGDIPPRPDWFGGDDEQWGSFLKWNGELIGKAKTEARTEALNELKSKSEAEQKAVDEATTYMNSEVTAIEADKTLNPDGTKIDRNKLFKTALDFKLVDTEGRWNYRAAFLILKNQKVATKANETTDRKKLASDTTSDNRGETQSSGLSTSKDFSNPSNRPW